ncbi:MAG: alternative ribosome rescue aminoacyl-tRNA hydrolase ArfB [Steroidobacteraceae bacterium]
MTEKTEQQVRAADIPAASYRLRWVRAPGPGGQNVNKLATACQLRFQVGATLLLDEAGRERLRKLAGRRLNKDDELVIEAHAFRTREANLRDALRRLAVLLEAAARAPRKRVPTRPGRAARERRMADKRHRQRIKQWRGGDGD